MRGVLWVVQENGLHTEDGDHYHRVLVYGGFVHQEYYWFAVELLLLPDPLQQLEDEVFVDAGATPPSMSWFGRILLCFMAQIRLRE